MSPAVTTVRTSPLDTAAIARSISFMPSAIRPE